MCVHRKFVQFYGRSRRSGQGEVSINQTNHLAVFRSDGGGGGRGGGLKDGGCLLPCARRLMPAAKSRSPTMGKVQFAL